MARKYLAALAFVVFLFTISITYAQGNETCVTYMSGIGCPHCAKVDPYILGSWLNQYPNLVVIDYEVFQQSQNAYLLTSYDDVYSSGTGVPVLIIAKGNVLIGDTPILGSAPVFFNSSNNNPCPLLSGQQNFSDVNFSELPGLPKIWSGQRILIRNGAGGNDVLMKALLASTNISATLENQTYQKIDPIKVVISGGEIEYENAVSLGTWTFQWNGTGASGGNGSINGSGGDGEINPNLTWTKIITLAIFDSINPCAMAVLILVLLSILIANPDDKSKVLFSGLAFALAVFVMYLFYGLVIIKFFQVVQALGEFRVILYQIFALFAIVLGILNIKDFLQYKKGSWLTEMPVSLRPTVGKIIHKITSPRGAFFLGAVVTTFLLPCTVGPYIIAGGLLSPLEILETLPYLLVYNFIFTLPMILITFIIYFGFARPDKAFMWKQNNVKYLHLASGVIILGLGLAMLLGWV